MNANAKPTSLTLRAGLAYGLIAVAAFHLAYVFDVLGFLIVVYLYCLLQLSRAANVGQAVNLGWGVGLLVFGPQLTFFVSIFGIGGVVLWLVLGFWAGCFLAALGACRRQWGETVAALLAPVLWLGFEYLRSECYFLRFSWLNAGYVFANSPQLALLARVGVYGIGFVLMALAAIVYLLPRQAKGPAAIAALAGLAVLTNAPAPKAPVAAGTELPVAGVQFEGFTEAQALRALEALEKEHPKAQVLVLCEYAFDGPVPARVREWCRTHQKYLVAGGKEPLAGEEYYNTAYVVDPRGEVAFRQVKKVPLPFFKDGLPAQEQQVWNSPWGKIGICICYDLSFVRVTDELIRQGAQAIIVPTMDATDWGLHQHRLHTRVARMRAAEYGVPIFRVASSGISQLVDRSGGELAAASYPGELETIAGTVALRAPGTLALDRLLAQVAAGVALLAAAFIGVVTLREKFTTMLLNRLAPVKPL